MKEIAQLFQKHEAELVGPWISEMAASTRRSDLISDQDLQRQSKNLLSATTAAMQSGGTVDLRSSQWSPVAEILDDVTRSRATQGFSPSETATFIFALKKPVFALIRKEFSNDAKGLADMTWTATEVIDKLGLYSMESYQKAREEVITRQQQDLLELSTPVVKLWDRVLALPLIGTLDSQRTQVVMETLLQQIVQDGAEVAIIDITGVPTVDTLVAQHLLKTVTAARLMGADCIISGIRPSTAQTIVHLGVDLEDVVTKATLADAFRIALQRIGMRVTRKETSARDKQPLQNTSGRD